MAAKLDLLQADRAYYTARRAPALVAFGPLPYLTIQGRGEPLGAEFSRGVEALYPVAYGVKQHYKAQGADFAVPKLEGLWWVGDGTAAAQRRALEVPRAEWAWKLLLRLPEFVEPAAVEAAREGVARAKGGHARAVTFEHIDEGRCVQALHVGPYATEPETMAAILAYLQAAGLSITGLHHEIYLSDPRRGAPEARKTILRYPVA
jgi:hypothetical protein